MNKLKVAFIGMGGNFNLEDNFIVNVLKQHYQVEISEHPDYLFYSVNSDEHLKYNCVKIYYTAENLVPDFNLCDYGIAFNDIGFSDRYFRYPVYLVDSFNAYQLDDYATDLKRAMQKHEHVDEYIKQKDAFCSFVYSNAEAAKCRENMFAALNRYKQVNSGGRYQNNIGAPVDSKLDFQTKHKFVIAFENTSTPGYTTEKIVHAFSAGAIPIYWGNPEIEKEFNGKAFINCHNYGLKADTPLDSDIYTKIMEQVKALDNDPVQYQEMLAQPAFAADFKPLEEKQKFEDFLVHIFEQPKEDAYRRNRYYWGERYERKQRIGTKFYWQLRKVIPVRDFIKKAVKKNEQ